MITGLSIVVMTVVLTQANVTPLAQAHAHNDYLHEPVSYTHLTLPTSDLV